MAASDSTKFTSSAEVFAANRTLPQIRSIHTALHAEVEDKASRLRTQVGGSYRDLLGTADTIVQMRGDNDAIQDLLGKMGWRCGSAVVSTKAARLAKFASGEKKQDVAEAGRQKLLDGCLLVVGRLLKGRGELDQGASSGDRLVLAAKVWVLSRLLVNSLGSDYSEYEAKHATEAARKALDSLRRRLRRAQEKIIEKYGEESDRDDVLKALSSHSLASSSGAKDTLRHFLEVRLKAIFLTLDVEDDDRIRPVSDVVQGLRLYTRTLLDVQALVPAKLSQALNAQTKSPLLEDPSLQKLEGLRLDIFQRWCSEEIQCYTPFIRHDDIDGQQARDMFSSWLEKGREVVLNGLKKTLEQMVDFNSIIELRTNILQLWIREGSRIRGFDPQDIQDNFREVINARMLAVLEDKVTKLRLVGSEVRATLDSWHEGITGKVPGLWDNDGYDEAFEIGAVPFLQEVSTRYFGRSDAVSKATNCYNSWFHIIDDVKGVVEQLRKQRWDNDYDEIEDEETIETRQQLLSKDDPKMLQEKLDTSLEKAFQDQEDEFRELWQGKAEGENSGSIAMYFLRVVREIRQKLPQQENIRKFCVSMVPELHRKIVVSVLSSPIEKFVTQGLPGRIVVSRPLWEGDPALPNQPSPEVFQFLSNLSVALSDAGVDIWTPVAVKVLKKHVSKVLCEAWSKELESLSPTESEKETEAEGEKKAAEDEKTEEVAEENNERDEDDNEEADKKENEASESQEKSKAVTEDEKDKPNTFTTEQMRDLCTQWLFDISYLQCSIGSAPGEAADGLAKLEEAVHKRGGLDDKSRQRVGRGAKGFWKRTSLLFGLLE